MSSNKPTLPSLFPVRNLPAFAMVHYGQLPSMVINVVHPLMTIRHNFNPEVHDDCGIVVLPDGVIQGCTTLKTHGDAGLPEGSVWLVRGVHKMTPNEIHRTVEAKLEGACGFEASDDTVKPLSKGMFALGGWYQDVSGVWCLASDFEGLGLGTLMIDHFGTKRFCFGMAAGAVYGVERDSFASGAHPSDIIPSVRMTPNGVLLGPDGGPAQPMTAAPAVAPAEPVAAPTALMVGLGEASAEAAEAKSAVVEGWQALRDTVQPESVENMPIRDQAMAAAIDAKTASEDVGHAEVQNFGEAPKDSAVEDKPAE